MIYCYTWRSFRRKGQGKAGQGRAGQRGQGEGRAGAGNRAEQPGRAGQGGREVLGGSIPRSLESAWFILGAGKAQTAAGMVLRLGCSHQGNNQGALMIFAQCGCKGGREYSVSEYPVMGGSGPTRPGGNLEFRIYRV